MKKLKWRRRSYVWLLQGWYEELWWRRNGRQGGDGVEGGGDCSDDEVLSFLEKQRVLTVSHIPLLSSSSMRTTCGLVKKKFHFFFLD